MSTTQLIGNLLKFEPDRIKGFEVKRINAVSGIYVVDTKGYIGLKINDYFSQNGSPYPGNYALVAKGPSYQNLGLGRVTFLEDSLGSVTIGDKTYRTVMMPDGKEWMAENLDFLPDDGSIANNPNVSRLPSYAAAWYYNKDEATYGWEGKKYGLLYNWHAVAALTIAGWHVPTKDEVSALYTACGNSSAGLPAKLSSTIGWDAKNGTDTYGFTAYPSGLIEEYSSTPTFRDIGKNAIYWTKTKESQYVSNSYYFYPSSSFASISTKVFNVGCAVRLVKDSV